MVSLHLCAILVLEFCFSVGALSITDRFNVDVKSNDYGGCGWVGENVMDRIINECLTLANIGVTLLDDFDSKSEANRLLNAYFTQKVKLHIDRRSEIKGRFVKVRNWITNGGPVNDEQSDKKPRLFCHHKWLTKQAMTDTARDSNGNEVTKTIGSQKLPVPIQDIQDYVSELKKQEDAMHKAGIKKPAASPYWSEQLKSYVFDKSYGSSNLGFCSASENRAATQHKTTASTITLCPSSFGTTNSLLTNENVVRLRAPALNPTRRDAFKEGDQDVKAVLPTSATLFHELFHLVLGNDNTNAVYGEVYALDEILQLTFPEALENPETFTLTAVAYHNTLQSTPDQNGWGIEFYSGFTTQN